MRVLVTGSSGFVGSEIVDHLCAEGVDVRCLDRRAEPVPPARRRDRDSGVPRREHLVGDVTDRRVLDKALVGVDVVCHQAAKVGLGVDAQDLPGYAVDNVVGTAQLLAAMDGANVGRLVLASSMVVYGEGRYDCPAHGRIVPPPRLTSELSAGRFEPGCPRCGRALAPELVDETAHADPRNGYASTKLAQEHLAASWARQTGGSAIALRYHNVYGPRMPVDTPYAGVASIFRSQVRQGRPPRVFEDGAQRRDFVHVSDIAEANLVAFRALGSGDVAAGVLRSYNVGSGEVRTILDLARAISAALEGPAPEVTGEFRLGDVRHITASSQRMADELGWHSRVRFDEGMTALARVAATTW